MTKGLENYLAAHLCLGYTPPRVQHTLTIEVNASVIIYRFTQGQKRSSR